MGDAASTPGIPAAEGVRMIAEEFRTEGWRSVDSGDFPPGHETVEFARDERVHRQPPWFGQWGKLPPEFNSAGLWWRTA
jgi:hypothetical protein